MILLTDVISQSSNFCWIVLDETTYYITAFAVDSNNTVISSQTVSVTTDFGWHPSANTLAYFPFESDGLDALGNYTLSNTGTQQTLGRTFTAQSLLSGNTSNINTALIWCKLNARDSSVNSNYVQLLRVLVLNSCFSISGQGSQTPAFRTYANQSSHWGGNQLIGTGSWHLIAITRSKSGTTTTLTGYVDGNKYQFYSGNIGTDVPDSMSMIYATGTVNMVLSKFIMENKTWSQSEIQDYFNKTKSKYGL